MHLDRCVEVVFFLRGVGRLHFDHPPSIAFAQEDVAGYERVVGDEARLVNYVGAVGYRLTSEREPFIVTVLSTLYQHSTREPFTRQLANLGALVESVLQDNVGLEFNG
jgi:hypothetical protein